MTVPVSDLIGAAPTATGGVAKAGAYDVAEGDPGARKVEFAAPAPSRRLQKNSAVLLLADMLRPEGVDEDLEGDIAEECSKVYVERARETRSDSPPLCQSLFGLHSCALLGLHSFAGCASLC